VPVFGRPVEIQTLRAGKDNKVKGELLALGSEQLWVLEPARTREVPLSEIEQVRVRLHELDGKRTLTWAAVGGIASAAALTVACSSVEDTSCGGIFYGSVIPWAVFGGLSARSLETSSRVLIRAPDLAALRPYARYPQGLPAGLDPATLVRKKKAPPTR
jgi:hypothetical protein